MVEFVVLITIFANYHIFIGNIADIGTIKALASHNKALQKAISEQKQEISIFK
jgi:hypothetical protein